MRLLHTSDWHVGRGIRGRSREDEFDAVLSELVRLAKDEKADVVLVSGDVYDQRVPTPSSDQLVFRTFIQLHEAGIPAVVIPGNHDSAARLAALGVLLEQIHTSVVPFVLRPEAGGQVQVRSRDQRETALIACVPFVPERRFGDAAKLFEASENWFMSYADGMSKLLQAMTDKFQPGTVNVVMGHLFADGALLGGGEREVLFGVDYAIPPSRLPANANYVALGHVHRPQAVKGAPGSARYAGSLLQLDFGESDQQKSVTIVDARPGKPSKIREVPLRAGRRLVTLTGTLSALPELGADVGDAFLRVVVKTDGPVPGIVDRVRTMFPNAVAVHLDYERAELVEVGTSLASLEPREQFLAYYRRAHSAEPQPPLLQAFDEVLEAEQMR